MAKVLAASDSGVTETIEGTVLGTAAYMSPEQAQGKPLDERSDIFSFGAVLYELVSGRRPFAGSSMVEVLSAVLRDEPLPPAAPAAVADVVHRCMAKRAVDRFASMAEAKAALDQITSNSSPEPLPSIAVLPFANMSGDRENEYFSDGLAVEIINALVQVSGLKVTARFPWSHCASVALRALPRKLFISVAAIWPIARQPRAWATFPRPLTPGPLTPGHGQPPGPGPWPWPPGTGPSALAPGPVCRLTPERSGGSGLRAACGARFAMRQV